MFEKTLKIFYTVKNLRYIQLYYQLYYRLKRKRYNRNYSKKFSKNTKSITWEDRLPNKKSYLGDHTFKFLNISYQFEHAIDWNYESMGKLWTYNLNYFDYLNQNEISVGMGIEFIEDFINKYDILKDGLESFPISVRGINWIKFLSKNDIENTRINQNLFDQYQILIHNLEYHLLGNHLLENGFSLLFGSYYFSEDDFYTKAFKILRSELDEQILKDGAHFELSPMYHQLILFRLLDAIQLLQLNFWKQDVLLSFLISKAQHMLGWLEVVTFRNGNIPMVNDSTYDIAPSSKEIFYYAKAIGLTWKKSILNDSGYRKFHNGNYECFIDIGNIGPDYIPGHAHADTFSFELYIREKPCIVDVGTSTYEKNQVRQLERSTKSHNTVLINNKNQSDVWGGFRVAKRAKIIRRIEKQNEIIAAHDGYKNMRVIHERNFKTSTNSVCIADKIIGKTKCCIAYFHFHPSVKNIILVKNTIVLSRLDCEIKFSGDLLEIEQTSYNYATGFNKTEEACAIKVSFSENLKSHFLIIK